MEEEYCPLSLEFVPICVVHKNNVSKGLRERILSVTDGSPIELTEKVVEEFVDEVPMAVKLERFRKTLIVKFVDVNPCEEYESKNYHGWYGEGVLYSFETLL